ncbi:MAG: hypothetical protein VX185_15745 [Pseudomonadota bacterium]|nr:hypothetical protein [Pseudomonadota bacterium]
MPQAADYSKFHGTTYTTQILTSGKLSMDKVQKGGRLFFGDTYFLSKSFATGNVQNHYAEAYRSMASVASGQYLSKSQPVKANALSSRIPLEDRQKLAASKSFAADLATYMRSYAQSHLSPETIINRGNTVPAILRFTNLKIDMQGGTYGDKPLKGNKEGHGRLKEVIFLSENDAQMVTSCLKGQNLSGVPSDVRLSIDEKGQFRDLGLLKDWVK